MQNKLTHLAAFEQLGVVDGHRQALVVRDVDQRARAMHLHMVGVLKCTKSSRTTSQVVCVCRVALAING